MFMRLLAPIFLSLSLLSCSENVEPYRIFRADFSPAMIEGAEALVREIATERGLYLYEQSSRNELRPDQVQSSTLWLFRDEQAHVDQNWILTVSTWVDGGTITVMVVDPDHSGEEIGFVDRLVSELKNGLEKRLGLSFCRKESKWPVCKLEGKPRLLYKADVAPALIEGMKDLIYDLADNQGVHMLLIGSDYALRDGDGPVIEMHVAHGDTIRHGKPEVVISNFAKASIMTLSAFDHGETPTNDVDDLTRDLKQVLERDFGLDFCRANLATSLCDAEYDAREVEREGWMEARSSNSADALEALLSAHGEGQRARAARRRLERLRIPVALSAPDAVPPHGVRRVGKPFANSLRSGGFGPEMTVIPAGWFLMGCMSRPDCDYKEGPVRTVSVVQPFAISTHEVTYQDYYRFANPRGRLDESWSQRPAVHVSWGEASAYAEWLSTETGAHYRLPSEAEWEYAARSGSAKAYAWGNETETPAATYWRSPTRPARLAMRVGSHAPNAWGLFDMHGNVAEWVSDCWNPDYLGSPSDGSSWTRGDCSLRVVRGGSWSTPLRDVRSASRARKPAEGRYIDIGFRVVMELADGWDSG